LASWAGLGSEVSVVVVVKTERGRHGVELGVEERHVVGIAVVGREACWHGEELGVAVVRIEAGRCGEEIGAGEGRVIGIAVEGMEAGWCSGGLGVAVMNRSWVLCKSVPEEGVSSVLQW
jgi:hypothetical protein